MFKKLTIATAISSAILSSYLTAEVLPSAQMNLQNSTVIGANKSRFIVKFKQLKQLPSQQSVNVRDTPIHEKGESQLAFQRTLASGDIVVEVENFSTIDNLLKDLSLNGDVISIEEDEVVGEAATALYKDAREMLDRIIKDKLFVAKGVVGLSGVMNYDNHRLTVDFDNLKVWNATFSQ